MSDTATDFIDTYQTPLCTYLQTQTDELEKTLTDVTTQNDTINTEELEQRVELESNLFIKNVTNRLHHIRDEIKARRPTDANDTEAMNAYRHFLGISATGMTHINEWFERIINRVKEITEQIIEWIQNQVERVVSFAQDIHELFRSVWEILTL
ncbi:hypothetical protein I4U23_004601 [Adineta vaga]|nr:hypothetical protein I4U23_004601 [Adineta vaga]